MISILIGLFTVCTQTPETVRICIAHYTNPAEIHAVWQDYQRFHRDIDVYLSSGAS